MNRERTFEMEATTANAAVASSADLDSHLPRARKLRSEATAAAFAGAFGRIDRSVRALVAGLARWYEQRRTRDALMRCSDRVLADIGIERERIPLIAKGIDPAEYPLRERAVRRWWAAARSRLEALRQARRERHRLYRELDAYSDRELEEIGLRRADIPAIARGEPVLRRADQAWPRPLRRGSGRSRAGAVTMATRGLIRRLWAGERDQVRDHLLRLDLEDRQLRFAGYASASHIAAYCEGLEWSRGLVLGYVVAGQVRGLGELKLVGNGSPRAAELAVSVEHPFQNRGIGTALLRRLVVSARNRLIDRIHMVCLIENGRAVRMARRLDGALRFRAGEAEAVIEPPWPTPWTWLEEALLEFGCTGVEQPAAALDPECTPGA